ncbi:glycerol kinase-like, partial [Bidens hawaiensis]|uniref:glycerol kinase-like n=1 Tax=Bidens hawaiensis TaxID=980011 RepID=UPI004049E6AF
LSLKLLWLLENVDAVKQAVNKGDALFGTIDSWLIWNLTGGVNGGLHVTDVSNASRTMLMNLKTLNWDESTLQTLKIPKNILPKIISNAEVIGHIAKGWLIPGVPISGCLGYQHAAMLGQSCKTGEAKSTFGTGAFILLNTGEQVIKSKHGLLTTLAYKLGKDAPTNKVHILKSYFPIGHRSSSRFFCYFAQLLVVPRSLVHLMEMICSNVALTETMLLSYLDLDTVDFVPDFDNSLKPLSLLHARIPTLLCVCVVIDLLISVIAARIAGIHAWTFPTVGIITELIEY